MSKQQTGALHLNISFS